MLRDSDTNRKPAKRFRTQADTCIDDGRQMGRTQLARLGDESVHAIKTGRTG